LKLGCRIIFSIIVWSIALLLYTDISNCSELDRDKSEWDLAKEKSGVEVFCRKVKELDFKEFKGIIRIKTSLACLMALMDDTSAYTSWLHFCDDARLIGQISRTERYIYLVYDVSSFPGVKDRDMVIRSRVFQSPQNRAINIGLEKASLDEVPDLNTRPAFMREAGVTRVKEFRVSWMFTPVENSYIEVVYQVYVDPAPSRFAKSRVNPAIEKLVYETLKNMKSMVNRTRYKDADPDIIREIPEQESCP
jgi:hypothetical protein